jgi:hypothetical protein
MPSLTSVVDPTIVATLNAVADVLVCHDQHSARRFESRLRGVFPSVSEFVATFDTNEFWGGAGSLADQGMCCQALTDPELFRSSRRAYWQNMARFGRYLSSHGAGNPQLDMWVDVFERWCKDGL